MSKTRIGFIGAGIIDRRHIMSLGSFDDVEIAAFADVNLDAAREAAAKHNVASYSSHQEMLDKEKPDAVYICVPPFAHGPLEMAAVERDLPFFVEKPLSLDYATAAGIADAVNKKKLVTAVGYHWRYSDTVEQAKELLKERPARLVLGYWLDATPPLAWWRRKEQSGGQMDEQTTHIFDLARLLAGEVDTVYAVGSKAERAAFPDADVDDVSVATLTFKMWRHRHACFYLFT